MSDRDESLDAEQLRGLFQEVADGLAERGEHARLFVVGGAAMALAYDAHRVTRDVDALFMPARVVREVAEEVAARHGLPEDWLNDVAKGFLPGNDPDAVTVFDSEALLVQVPSAPYLLAMKLHAARDERDLDDAARLYGRAGLTTADEGRALLARTHPVSQLLPRHRYIVEEVAARAAALRSDLA